MRGRGWRGGDWDALRRGGGPVVAGGGAATGGIVGLGGYCCWRSSTCCLARWQGFGCVLAVAMVAGIVYSMPMTTLTLDLPEALTAELDAAVQAGWFTSQAEAVRAAVRDLVSHRKLALLETQQMADIDWAVKAAAK